MGKVHGSLARAGKVKAQTAKVEQQEKSKEVTGRAKRRLQFNKRSAVIGKPTINSQVRQQSIVLAKKTQQEVIAAKKH
jgi:small subunit ribosomal protein S30e